MKRVIKSIRSADGLEGCLIYCGHGKYKFRVYTENHEFTDYDISHWDLSVRIVDPDAFLYEYENDENWLDHSPETLGMNL